MATATFYTGRGPVLMAVIWTWAGIATILYALRAVNASRAPRDQKSFLGLRWDFIWVTIGYVNALVANAFLTVSVVYGTGNHQPELTAHQAVYSALWSWIGQICAIFSLVWARFAVIAFMRELQGPTYQNWRYALYVVGTAQALINTIEVVLILNQCSPIQKLWNFSLPGTCGLIGVTSKVGFLQGSIGAFADFFLALYPPAVIIGPLQQMKIHIKIALCLIMGGGVFAGIAGIVKTISIESITHTDDISYATLDLLVWVMTEVWFIIIFGSLPAIRAVLYSTGRSLKTMTQAASGKTKTSQYSQSRSPNWMELSGVQESTNREYRREYDKSGFSAQIDHEGPDRRKAERHNQNRNGMRKYGSEEEILAPGRHDIVTTKEWTVTRSSDEMSRDTLPRRP